MVAAIANFHSYPSQGESQILTKEHCTVVQPMLGYLTLSSSQTAGRSCEKGYIGHVTHNSSKRMSQQKVGMSKVAYHRMLVGGLDVVKRANAETR